MTHSGSVQGFSERDVIRVELWRPCVELFYLPTDGSWCLREKKHYDYIGHQLKSAVVASGKAESKEEAKRQALALLKPLTYG